MWFLSFIPDSMLKVAIHGMLFAGLFLTFEQEQEARAIILGAIQLAGAIY